MIDQNLVSSTNDPDIGQIDMKIAELTKQVAVDEEAIRVAENELKAFNSMMSLEEASSELKKVLQVKYLYTFRYSCMYYIHICQLG